jgi:diaminopimelate decarboxylase/aspartate kinase
MSAAGAPAPWVVCKYGGTSVATAATWASIAARVRALLPARRVWRVGSAVSGVTNLLLASLDEAVRGGAGAAARPSLRALAAKHEALAAALGLTADDFAPAAALRDVFGALGIDPVPTVRGKVLAYLHEHRPAHYAALGASGLLAAKLG